MRRSDVMTVGDLKRRLGGLRDDMLVVCSDENNYDPIFSPATTGYMTTVNSNGMREKVFNIDFLREEVTGWNGDD